MNDIERENIERVVAVLALRYRLLTPEQAQEIIVQGREGSTNVLDLLRRHVREADLLRASSHALGGKPVYYDLADRRQLYRIDETVLRRADIQYLKQYSALPLVAEDGSIAVAIAYIDPQINDYLNRIYGPSIRTYLLSPLDQIQNKLALFASTVAMAAISEEMGGTQVRASATGSGRNLPPTSIRAASTVVVWLDNVLARAAAEGASDIHLSVRDDDSLKLELRVDGRLRHVPAPLSAPTNELIAAVMGKAQMDQSNVRTPQSGTFAFQGAGRNFDARVEVMPAVTGPYMVIRLLDSRNVLSNRLDDMGFSTEALNVMRETITQSQGGVIISGPTGSGKSTTLYSLLREVDSVSRNVITMEDPVEYRLPGIKQVPMRLSVTDKSKVIDFQRALRSVLRMDPDVLLVGEIRDHETSKAAMDAIMTGHLVLSTLHASSAIGIYTRLMELGTPGYLVANALDLGIAQRLLRRLHDCARMDFPTRDEADWFEQSGLAVPAQVGRAVGCGACAGGYKGRLAVVEYVTPSRRFRRLVSQQASYEELEDEAIANGFQPIVLDGVRHATAGRTTVSEVSRVLHVGTSEENA